MRMPNSNVVQLATVRSRYKRLISRQDARESTIHRFLSKYPILLPVEWPIENRVFSEFQRGTQKRPDFVFAREDSLGVRWHLIEIEKPSNRLFTKSGDPTKELTHALRQLHDWRTWMLENRDYVLRHFPFQGRMARIGLTEPSFTLIMGRRLDPTDNARALARRLSEHPLHLMSFDRLGERLGAPWYDADKPLRSCTYANGRITEIANVRMDVRFVFGSS